MKLHFYKYIILFFLTIHIIIFNYIDLNKLANEPYVKDTEQDEELQITEEASSNQKYYVSKYRKYLYYIIYDFQIYFFYFLFLVFKNNSSHGNEFEELISMSSSSTWNNDPAILSKILRFTPEMIDLVLKWGPCQPKSNGLPNGKFPKESNRCFH